MANTETPSSNLFTVLVFVALLVLLAGVIYVIMRSNDLFQTWNPMDAKDLSVFLPEKLQALVA